MVLNRVRVRYLVYRDGFLYIVKIAEYKGNPNQAVVGKDIASWSHSSIG
jgi:hypothetical protein